MGLSLYLYLPNLIGYARILFMFTGYYFSNTNPYIFAICYFMGHFLDMFDGMAARAFNQCTNFGAMLDMVVDRCSTCGLMLVLAQRVPKYTMFWHAFLWIDICSHWCHMLSSLKSGLQSHKLIATGPKLLQYYYKTHWFMVLLIIGAESFPISIYLSTFSQLEQFLPILKIIGLVMFPLFALKHIINIIQFCHGGYLLDHVSAHSS